MEAEKWQAEYAKDQGVAPLAGNKKSVAGDNPKEKS